MIQFSVSSGLSSGMSSGMEGAIERERFVDGGRVDSDRVSSLYLDDVGLAGESGRPISAAEERLERGSS